MFKITIDNEEVLCDKNFTIQEEMLNTSSTILNNVYPVEWEEDKDYVSRFYYPKDYSKCKIFNEIVHPEEKSTASGTNFTLNNVDLDKEYYVEDLKGQTTQSGTPTPTNPIPINITTGRQVVSVAGKNLFSDTLRQGVTTYNTGQWSNSTTRLTSTNWIPLKAGTYTISANTTITGNRYLQVSCVTFDTNDNFYNISGVSGQWKKLPFTFTTPVDLNWKCNVSFNDSYSLTPSDVYDIQIEKGSQATTYEEYKGTDYEINLGKNLFNGTLYNTQVGSNGGITSSTTRVANVEVGGTSITYIPQGTYTLSIENLDYCSVLTKQGSTIIDNFATSWHSLPFTFTTTQGAYLYFTGRKSNNSTISPDDYSPQVEKGSQPTTYTPYKTPIYLGEIGNYKDYIFRNTTENPLYDENLEEGQWYIHKEIGRVVLNGSENWGYSNSIFNIPESLHKYIGSTITCMSNYFKGGYNKQSATNYYNGNDDNTIGFNRNNILVRDDSITSSTNFKTWLNTHNTSVYYVLNTPQNTLIEDEELISQLNSIQLISGLNNIIVSSAYLPGIIKFLYNYAPAYTEEDLYFCGIVKNTGEISLNPRYPHYCNLQVLDFKDFLSQGETLDFVITDKTIGEAIDQVIGTIAPYGFIKGNILLDDIDDAMGTYSTKDKTAYDVFNYIADITQSRWTTRMIDENTIAIDFYDPNKLPMGTAIDYTNEWFCTHKINDINYSYSSNDYRNKQVMLSGEVYSNIETTEIIVADGYQTQFNTIDKLGKVSSLLLNGTPVSIITKDEYDLGYDADFYYQPGNKYFESVNLVSTGAILTIVYFAIIEGREVILNQDEISRVENMTGRKGIIARYENRNDATTTGELQAIGQSYLEYKGTPEIKLNITSRENTWNIGDRVYFNAPLDELKQTYMVKSKKIQRITTIDEMFYQYELTSSFNMEQDINYFDNQRFKSKGNIGEGEFISRNVDIENTANVIFYDLDVQEVEIEGNSTLQAELQAPLGVE